MILYRLIQGYNFFILRFLFDNDKLPSVCEGSRSATLEQHESKILRKQGGTTILFPKNKNETGNWFYISIRHSW